MYDEIKENLKEKQEETPPRIHSAASRQRHKNCKLRFQWSPPPIRGGSASRPNKSSIIYFLYSPVLRRRSL